MEQHDKGGALPKRGRGRPRKLIHADSAAAERGRERHANLILVMEVIREFAGSNHPMALSEIVKRSKFPASMVEGLLKSAMRRGRVKRVEAVNEDSEVTWSIPAKHMKAHRILMMKQSAEAARLLEGWTVSSICSRLKHGMPAPFASYPYVGRSSLTTTPLT